jgi:hypothetical protein
MVAMPWTLAGFIALLFVSFLRNWLAGLIACRKKMPMNKVKNFLIRLVFNTLELSIAIGAGTLAVPLTA